MFETRRVLLDPPDACNEHKRTRHSEWSSLSKVRSQVVAEANMVPYPCRVVLSAWLVVTVVTGELITTTPKQPNVAVPVLHLNHSDSIVGAGIALHSFTRSDGRIHLYYPNNAAQDKCHEGVPATSWRHLSTLNGESWTPESKDFLDVSVAPGLDAVGPGGLANLPCPYENATLVVFGGMKKKTVEIVGRQAFSPASVSTDPRTPGFDEDLSVTHVSPFFVDGKTYLAASSIKEEQCTIRLYSVTKQRLALESKFQVVESKRDPLKLSGLCPSFHVYCKDTNKCIIAYQHVAAHGQGAYGARYLLGGFSDEGNDQLQFFPYTAPDKPLVLDAGHDILQYAFTSIGEPTQRILAIGWGSRSFYAKAGLPQTECRRTLSTLRTVFIESDYIRQKPVLEGFHTVGRIESTKSKTLKLIEDTNSHHCSYSRKLKRSEEVPEAFSIQYTFKNAKMFKETGWRVLLRLANNRTRALSVEFNPTRAANLPDMTYGLDRTNVTTSLLSSDVMIARGNLDSKMKQLDGTVEILLDNGIVEVFFENGRYLVGETIDYENTQFDEICIQAFGKSGVELANEKIVTFQLSRQPGDEGTRPPVSTAAGKTSTAGKLGLYRAGVMILLATCFAFLLL